MASAPFPFVRSVTRLREVDSTSTEARRRLLADSPCELPLLILADRQTAGRGRGANAWWSDSGSLTFTVAIDPAAHGIDTSHEPRLALSLGAFLAEGFVAAGWLPGGRVGIRWPNDIECAGRKLAGILLERIQTPAGTRTLLGVGVNVSTQFVDAPADVSRLATSLANEGPIAPDAHEQVLLCALEAMRLAVEDVASSDESQCARWNAHDLLRGERVRVDLGNRVVEGIGRGIDAAGHLCLDTVESGLVRLSGGRVLRGPLPQ